MSQRIAILTDDPGWHGAELHKAFGKRGFECTNASLTDCYFEIGTDKKSLSIPGFEQHLPDGVFVRGVPGGSLEEVVFYLDILHALREVDIMVYNDVRAIERSVDKAMTSFLLHQAGVPTPLSWIGNNIHQAYSFIRKQLRLGHKIVAKPLFGSQGKNLQLIARPDDITDLTVYNKIYYLQRFIDTGSSCAHDWRLFVVGDQVIAGMRREGSGWISNIANGGKCYPATLDQQFIRIAEDAVKAIDMHYGGVDIMRDRAGKLWVTEINSIPAWKGLQSVSKVTIANSIAEHFVNCLQKQLGVT